MATRFTYIGDEDHARSLKSVGARELSQLRHDMHFQSLSQGRRYLELPDGTRIYTTSVGGYDLVTIHTPIRIEEKKKIKKEEYNELFFTKRFFIKLRKPGVVPFSLFWLVVLPDEVAEISDLDLDFLDNEGVVVLSTFVLVPITQIDVNNLLPSHRDRSTEYCSYEIPVLAEGSRRVVYTVSASNRYIRHQVQESAAALRIEELALTNEFMNVRVFGNRLLLFHSETTLSPDGYGVPEITVAWISFDPTGIPVQDNFGSDWHDNGLGRHGDGLHWSVIRAVSATELVVWYCAGREIFEYTVDVTSFPIQLVQSPERIEDAGVYTALWQLPVGYVETDTIEITIPHTFIPQTTLRCNMDNLDGTTVLTVAHTDYHWAQYTFFEIYDADILDISYSMGDISFTYDGHLTTSRYVSAQFFAHPATSFQEWVDMAHTWPRNCDATMFPLWHTITHVAAVCKGNSPHSHPYPPGGVTFKYGIVNDFEMYATVKQDRQDTHYARGMGEYDPAKSVKFYGTVDIGGPIPNCVAQVSNLTKIILKYGGSWASEGPHTDWPCLTVSGINQITVNYLRRQEIDCVLVPDGQGAQKIAQRHIY